MTEESTPPARPRRSRHRSAADRVRKTNFPVAMRGYERTAVDAYVAEVVTLVEHLESTQLREGVVQRALDEVGEQTSGILQHAHETAEEITARSRSQAEGRLQRAEQEADEVRREADRYAEQVVEDTRRLWQERQRLIEDMRQLADEVLGVADDALERVEQPDTGFISAEPPDPTLAWDSEKETVDERERADDQQAGDQPAGDQPAGEQQSDDTTSEFEAPATPHRE